MNSVTCNIEGVGPVSLITDGPQTVLGGNAFALNKFARGALLMGIDLVALFLASICGYLVWVRAVLDQPSDPYVALLPMIMAFPILFTVGGLYSEARMATVEMLKRSWQYTSLGFLLLASATFAMKVGYAYSRVSFAAMWLLSLVLVPLFRTLAVRFLQERRWWLEPAIYVDWRANGTAD